MSGYAVPEWEGKTLDWILGNMHPGRSLRIETVRLFFPAGRSGLMLFSVDPGAPRRVPIKLCPMIVGDQGQTHADLLELVATALRLSYETRAESVSSDG